MILTGMLFLMMGLAMTHQWTLIGEKPKDKRPGMATQLLGVGMIYFGWMTDQHNFLVRMGWESLASM